MFVERNWHDNLDFIRGVVTERHKLIQNFSPRWPYRPTLDLEEAPTWTALKRQRDAGTPDAVLERRYFQDERPRTEFYDLDEDLAELPNRADATEYADAVDELQNVLSNWMEDTCDFVPPLDGAFGGLDLDVDPISGS